MITSTRPSAQAPKLTPRQRPSRVVVSVMDGDLAEKDVVSRIKALEAENSQLSAALARLLALCRDKGLLHRDIERARKGS